MCDLIFTNIHISAKHTWSVQLLPWNISFDIILDTWDFLLATRNVTSYFVTCYLSPGIFTCVWRKLKGLRKLKNLVIRNTLGQIEKFTCEWGNRRTWLSEILILKTLKNLVSRNTFEESS